YTSTGQRATEVKSTGETTSYAYDALDRLLGRTDPDGRTISYAYDAAGNRTTVVTPVGITSYTFDALNRMATVTDPDGGTTQYAYDAVGNRSGVAYPNGTVAQYTYDALNRLTNLLNRTSGGATISSYAYTLGPAGNRTRVVEDTDRTVDYTYDALYRLTREQIADAGETTTVDYSYDPVGNRLTKTQTTSAATTTTTYAYDNNDRLLTETVAVARVMTPQGEVQYAQLLPARPSPAAPYLRTGFFSISLLILLMPLALASASDRHLGRHSRWQRRCVRALCVFMIPLFVLGGENVWAINREAMLYEAMAAAGVTQPGATTHTYSYDNNGNTTGRTDGIRTDTYDYDSENRLASANVELGTTPGPVSYTYDADGIRTGKTTGAGTTSYLVDKNLPFAQVLVESTGGSTVSYVHGDDLISMKRPTGMCYYHYDGQTSTRKLSNATQVATDTYIYDAFGVELSHTGPTINDYKYTGEQCDANMGFYYLRARYYNQAIGRFATVDPFPGSVFDPTSLHRYLYAHCDPVDNLDPTGLFTLIQILVVSAIIGVLSGIVTYALTGSVRTALIVAVAAFFITALIMVCINYLTVLPRLLQQAAARYPALANNIHQHHVVPQYIVRALANAGIRLPARLANWTVPLNAAYHQMITNAIRAAFPFGPNVFANNPASLWSLFRVLLSVYTGFPIPL
ncbi:MAG: hypothetical protein JW741_23545, partial [Sedimentisphaerales bacterium]|nr:hypothetical protein [Sedimentisphaerales bacterium]